MAIGGSHRPTNLPYVVNAESGLEDYMTQGGIVVLGQAAATLLVGDVVFLTSTANQWNKSTTVGNYATASGIIVGGRATDLKVIQDDTR